MFTREQALEALNNAGCPPGVVRHILAVEKLASEIAREISENGHNIDTKLVEIGALLHDIGRSQTHGITHGVKGGGILRSLGLEKYVPFAENHLGAGIPADEAKELGLPDRDFVPKTLEEKVVTYADNLVAGNRVTSYEKAFEDFKRKIGAKRSALERFEKLHKEIQVLREGRNDLGAH